MGAIPDGIEVSPGEVVMFDELQKRRFNLESNNVRIDHVQHALSAMVNYEIRIRNR